MARSMYKMYSGFLLMQGCAGRLNGCRPDRCQFYASSISGSQLPFWTGYTASAQTALQTPFLETSLIVMVAVA